MTYPVAFSGSRDLLDPKQPIRALERLRDQHGDALSVHVGDARGLDSFVRQHCRARGIAHKEHVAHWKTLGKGAGHERNGRVIADAVALFAFFAPGPPSPGTTDAIGQAIAKGIPVYIWFANSRRWRTVGVRCQKPDCILAQYQHGHDEQGTWVTKEGNVMYAPKSMRGEVVL